MAGDNETQDQVNPDEQDAKTTRSTRKTVRKKTTKKAAKKKAVTKKTKKTTKKKKATTADADADPADADASDGEASPAKTKAKKTTKKKKVASRKRKQKVTDADEAPPAGDEAGSAATAVAGPVDTDDAPPAPTDLVAGWTEPGTGIPPIDRDEAPPDFSDLPIRAAEVELGDERYGGADEAGSPTAEPGESAAASGDEEAPRGRRSSRRRGGRRNRRRRTAEDGEVAEGDREGEPRRSDDRFDRSADDDQDGAERSADAGADDEPEVSIEPRLSRSARRRRARREKQRESGGKDRKPTPAPVADDNDDYDDDDEPEEQAPSDGPREMVINVSQGEECRIAVLHNGRLEELFLEREAFQSHVGNIYKGRITNVEPSIQAAFVDFGFPKNGFLHISDVQPQYFPNHDPKDIEDIGRKTPRRARPLIQQCFRRGQEVIVQITKEGVGTKGPTLTTYLSIPGRFLVMMPGMARHGVSRKVEDDSERRKMRAQLAELKLPPDMGFIVRTAGIGRNKRELQNDLNYLMRLWKTVVERIKTLPTPIELYRESDLVTRTIRDVYTSDFRRVVVDDADTANKVREFLRIAMPRTKAAVEEYTERQPLFHKLGLEEEIERIHSRHVPLPSGGSLVIDSTEALVAIDVNSGRFRSVDDAEESALKLNLEAADEIARQLRLRDLGGLIICDFIDMREERNKRKVERALRDALKSHKERARILRISAFGLIEMTRQRQRPSITRNLFHDCPHCKGTGLVKISDSVALDVMRIVQLAIHHKDVQAVTITLASQMAYRVLNRKRDALHRAENETGKRVLIVGNDNFASDQIEYHCEDRNGRPVTLTPGLGRDVGAS